MINHSSSSIISSNSNSNDDDNDNNNNSSSRSSIGNRSLIGDASLSLSSQSSFLSLPISVAGGGEICESLTIRHLRVCDLEDFMAYRTSEELSRFQGWTPFKSDDDALEFIMKNHVESTKNLTPAGSWWQIGIAQRDTDRLIGDIGLLLSD